MSKSPTAHSHTTDVIDLNGAEPKLNSSEDDLQENLPRALLVGEIVTFNDSNTYSILLCWMACAMRISIHNYYQKYGPRGSSTDTIKLLANIQSFTLQFGRPTAYFTYLGQFGRYNLKLQWHTTLDSTSSKPTPRHTNPRHFLFNFDKRNSRRIQQNTAPESHLCSACITTAKWVLQTVDAGMVRG